MTSVKSELNQSFSIQDSVRQKIDHWAPFVCQVARNEDSHHGGTGFLVAPGVLMTCSHVIPDPETAKKSHIIFETVSGPHRVEFDPDAIFINSPSPGNQPIEEESAMDFTVVALKMEDLHEDVRRICETAKSVFEDGVIGSSYPEMDRISIIHYPVLQGQAKEKIVGYGTISPLQKKGFNLGHKASSEKGSSGAPIFNKKGELLGMHRGHTGTVKGYGTAVPIEQILIQLKPHRETIEEIRARKSILTISQKLRERYRKINFNIELPMNSSEMSIRDFYVNLVLIKSEDQKEKETMVSFRKNSMFCERDSLIESHNRMTQSEDEDSIKIRDLFRQEGGKTPKKILIIGRAGVGKTTLIDKITFDWLDEKIYQDFEVVFRLPLRSLNGEKWVEKAHDTSEWISRAVSVAIFDDSDRAKEIKEFCKQHRGKMLLLLDGFDEADKKLTERLGKVIKDQNLHVIITSRPIPSLASLRGMDRRVENVGFSNKHIKKYCKKSFPDKKERLAFLRVLREDASIYSLAHTPLLLYLLSSLWESENRCLSSTLTGLYRAVVKNVREWNWERLGYHIDEVSEDRKAKTDEILGKVANEGLDAGQIVIPKSTLSREVLNVESSEIKSIQDIVNTGLMKVSGNDCYFFHLSFQEYFIALRISVQKEEGWRKFVRERGFMPQYALVLSFLAGLIHQNDDSTMRNTKLFFAILMEELQDLSGFYQAELMLRCFAECDREEFKEWISCHKFIEAFFDLVSKYLENGESISEKFIDLLKYIKNEIIFARLCELAMENFALPYEDIRSYIAYLMLEKLSKVRTLPIKSINGLIDDFITEEERHERAFRLLFIIARDEFFPKQSLIHFWNVLWQENFKNSSRLQYNWDRVFSIIAENQVIPEECINQMGKVLTIFRDYEFLYPAWVSIGENQFLPEVVLKCFLEGIQNSEATVCEKSAFVLIKVIPNQLHFEKIMKSLSTDLCDSNNSVRPCLISIIASVGKKRHLPDECFFSLWEASQRSKTTVVRSSAIEVLGQVVMKEDFVETTIPYMISALKDSEGKVRSKATQALKRIVKYQLLSKASIACLRKALGDRELYVKNGVILAIGELREQYIQSENFIDYLSETLENSEEPVQRCVISILGKIGEKYSLPEKVIDQLCKTLQYEGKEVQKEVIYTLKRIGKKHVLPERVMESLCTLLDDAKYTVKYKIIEAIGIIGKNQPPPEAIINSLIRMLKTSFVLEQAKISACISRVAGKDGLLESSINLLNDFFKTSTDKWLKVYIISIFKGLRKKANFLDSVFDLLYSALISPEKEFRRNSAHAFGFIGINHDLRIDCINLLVFSLRDPDKEVRGFVVDALRKIIQHDSSDRVLNPLVKALTSCDAKARSGAAKVIKCLNEDSPMPTRSVIKNLLPVLEDYDENISDCARDLFINMGRIHILPEEVICFLTEAQKDCDPNVRYLAAKAVGYLGIHSSLHKELIHGLIDSLNDYDENVQHFASQALIMHVSIKDYFHLIFTSNSRELFKVLLERCVESKTPLFFKETEDQHTQISLIEDNEEISQPLTNEQKDIFLEWLVEYKPIGSFFLSRE